MVKCCWIKAFTTIAFINKSCKPVSYNIIKTGIFVVNASFDTLLSFQIRYRNIEGKNQASSL